jgi:hypothetical protein
VEESGSFLEEAGMTRSFRAVAPAAALVFVLMAFAHFTDAEDAKTSFWVEEPNKDLGTVVAGESVTAAFVFHNDGPDDVNIIRAKPS